MKIVALDIETTGLYPIKGRDKIFCVAVNDGKTIKVYEDMEKIRALCEDPKTCKIIQNAAFDSFWLKTLHNIDVINIWDTKLCEQVLIGDNLLNEENATDEQKLALSSSLKWILKRYKLPVHDKGMSAEFARRPHNKPLTQAEREYVSDDVRYLHHIKALQEVRLTKLGLMRVANLENQVVEVVVRMRHAGIGLDKDLWEEIEQDHLNEKLRLLKKLPASVSNWNSPDQAKKYFQSKGIPVTSLEDLTDDFVKLYNDPVLNMFVEMRAHSTSASKYGSKFLIDTDKKSPEYGRSFVDSDSRIRANFFQILNTGRFSCSKPPLHGLPREGAQRSAFVPKKGHVFVGGDFSGQEIGIMAAASKEQLWIKALLRGEDPLSLMASMLFTDWVQGREKGCVFPKKCKCAQHKKQRQISKELTYGIAYGAYPKSISIKIKRTQKETQKLFYKHTKAAPNLARWLGKNSRETIATRMSYSADVYRRRRTVRDPQEWMVRNVGFNNPVQSCAANMIKLAMISLDKKWNQVLTWHDDLILEVPLKLANQAAKELKIVMEKAADYCTGVPGLIKVEPRIVKSLSK